VNLEGIAAVSQLERGGRGGTQEEGGEGNGLRWNKTNSTCQRLYVCRGTRTR
jgi:hypothetical protein